MVLLLAYVQFAAARPPPLPLFLLFVAVWTFGAAMLYARPLFGALGTALYGAIMAVQVLNMHGGSALNFAIAGGSLAATALALLLAFQLRRSPST